uniref:Uncharacterized protein n=1 Tax=Anguilla anguilla TaxID=7936 RepID=A0A0E9TLK3_ANGAN
MRYITVSEPWTAWPEPTNSLNEHNAK